jgi:SAM-dependent methyltransferase
MTVENNTNDAPIYDSVVRCRVCGAVEPVTEELSRTIRDDASGSHAIVRCPTCGLVQLTPQPSASAIADYYDHDRQARGAFPGEDHFQILKAKARADMVRRSQWLQQSMTGRDQISVLDIGCGYGLFVDYMCDQGFNATGLDASVARHEIAQREMSGEFIHGVLDDEFVTSHHQAFDAVTAFHVLEHMDDPVDAVRRMLTLVRKNGYLLIEVPNLDDELIYEIENYANHHWQFGHLLYFDKPRLENVASRAGAEDFGVKGVQRYGLDHLLTWTRTQAPDLSMPIDYNSTPLLDRAEANYRTDREANLTCDTLILTVRN